MKRLGREEEWIGWAVLSHCLEVNIPYKTEQGGKKTELGSIDLPNARLELITQVRSL